MRGWKKRLAIAAGVIALVLVVFVGVVSAVSEHRRAMRYEVDVAPIALPTDVEAVARGRHLVRARYACAGCHGDDLGGHMHIDSGAMGRFYAPNLTPAAGNAVASYQPADWARALRRCVGKDGRALLIMPCDAYSATSDRDLADVIAYFESLDPVPRRDRPVELGPVARLLLTFKGGFSEPQPSRSATHVEFGPTAEYGDYLAHTAGCYSCHGADLAGGHVPGKVAAPNITQHGLHGWTEAQVVRVMREGKRPDGRQLDPFMPYSAFANLSDTELTAMWAHLSHVPSVDR